MESKSKAIVDATTSDLEGCLEVPFGLASSNGFDNKLVIEFTTLILNSLEVQNLDFLDQSKTPQSQLLQPSSASEATDPTN